MNLTDKAEAVFNERNWEVQNQARETQKHATKKERCLRLKQGEERRRGRTYCHAPA